MAEQMFLQNLQKKRHNLHLTNFGRQSIHKVSLKYLDRAYKND